MGDRQVVSRCSEALSCGACAGEDALRPGRQVRWLVVVGGGWRWWWLMVGGGGWRRLVVVGGGCCWWLVVDVGCVQGGRGGVRGAELWQLVTAGGG